MNARNATISGALALMCAGLIARFGKLISDDVIIIGSVITGMFVLSVLLSWGLTEYYKRINYSTIVIDKINQHGATGVDHPKRNVYRMATWSGFGAMMINGVVFDLLSDIDLRIRIVMWTLWLLLSIVAGLSSPWLWRVMFRR